MSGRRRPLFAADAVALIGGGLGALLVGAGTGRWVLSLVLIVITVLAVALDVLRAVLAGPRSSRLWSGLQSVLAFDVFALGMLAGAWAAGGAAAWLAGALGALGLVVALMGYVFRRRVLAAFMAPGSSGLGLVLALVPAVVAIAGGAALVRAYPGPTAPSIVLSVVGLYVLLFAQAAMLRIQEPGWRPPPRPRPGSHTRPPADTRSKRR